MKYLLIFISSTSILIEFLNVGLVLAKLGYDTSKSAVSSGLLDVGGAYMLVPMPMVRDCFSPRVPRFGPLIPLI